MDTNPYPDAKIVVTGRLEPDPLSRCLPDETPVSLHLELILQGAGSPITIGLRDSFLEPQMAITSRFRSVNVKTGDEIPASRMICALKASGPKLNAKTDLITLYPDVKVSMVLVEKVRAHRGRPHVFGISLKNLSSGEDYRMEMGGHLWPMYWFYWGSKDEAIRSVPECAWDEARENFITKLISRFDIPEIDMAVEYSAAD